MRCAVAVTAATATAVAAFRAARSTASILPARPCRGRRSREQTGRGIFGCPSGSTFQFCRPKVRSMKGAYCRFLTAYY